MNDYDHDRFKTTEFALLKWKRLLMLAESVYKKYKVIYDNMKESFNGNNKFIVNGVGYDSVEDICTHFNITKRTVYSINNGSCKFNHSRTKHLKDTIVVSKDRIIELEKVVDEKFIMMNKVKKEYDDIKEFC